MIKTVRFESNEEFSDVIEGISFYQYKSTQYPTVLSAHWHDRMEIILIKNGSATFTCDKDIFEVKTGDVVVINPCQVHSMRAKEIGFYYSWAVIDLKKLLSQSGTFNRSFKKIISGEILIQHIIRNNLVVYDLVEKITDNATLSQLEYCEALFYGYIYQLIAILCSNHVSENGFAIPEQHKIINTLLIYIHDRYNEDLSLKNLSKSFCVSEAYLCRKFKEIVGEPPMVYLNTIRINRAFELLSTGDYMVNEVCRLVGFSDINNFTRQFKKITGQTPSKVKKQNKHI